MPKYSIAEGITSFTFQGEPYDVKGHHGLLECSPEDAQVLIELGLLLPGTVDEKAPSLEPVEKVKKAAEAKEESAPVEAAAPEKPAVAKRMKK
jgi:hypothetical protein